MTLSTRILREIRFQLVLGFDNHAALYEHVMANYGADPEVGSAPELVHAAIDAEIAKHIEESASWPARTDYDKLRAAFVALEQQHIVGLEMPGLTQDDGIPAAADLAAARDALQKGETLGYCFFTWNDAARAIDGEGLSLAYGTFVDEPEPPPAEETPKCPLCNGRGWVMAADPSHGSTFCACKSAPKVPDPEPPQSLGQRVGAAVVVACRDAGLEPEWTGVGSDYVELPTFRWQRRPQLVTEDEVQSFVAGWEMELRAGDVPSDDDAMETLEERMNDAFAERADCGPRLLARLRAGTDAFLAEERRREASWSEATTHDRIAGAFADLTAAGVFARTHLGTTIQDGWGYAGTTAPNTKEVVFLHTEDLIDAMLGEGPYVAFGRVGTGAKQDDEENGGAASCDLGRRIVAALRAHGVACEWNGSASHRIRIPPFEWRRRRWTTASSYERVTVADESPKATSEELGVVDAPRLGETIAAVRDEGRFDVARARRMRAAWTASGLPGSAQVAHYGPPPVFTATGERVAYAPRRAAANLGAERHDLFARGARAAK